MFRKKKKEKEEDAARDEFFTALEDAKIPETRSERKDEREREDNREEKTSLEELKNQPEWIDEEAEEGQLSVDVYEEDEDIIVKSTIAGVEPDDIDISIVNDMLTIRGERKQEKESRGKNYFFQECYWGAFSRSIILPVEVDVKKIDATIKNGILTVILPKLKPKDKKTIKVKDENQ